jgi:hypothetical protein
LNYTLIDANKHPPIQDKDEDTNGVFIIDKWILLFLNLLLFAFKLFNFSSFVTLYLNWFNIKLDSWIILVLTFEIVDPPPQIIIELHTRFFTSLLQLLIQSNNIPITPPLSSIISLEVAFTILPFIKQSRHDDLNSPDITNEELFNPPFGKIVISLG